MKKKFVATTLSAAVLTVALTGCGSEAGVSQTGNPSNPAGTSSSPSPSPSPSTSATEEESSTDTNSDQQGGTIRTTVGVNTSVSSSRAATDTALARAQVDSTIATVTVDNNGVIRGLALDAAQTRLEVEADGTIITDGVELRSKGELGDEYNMRRVSGIEREWDEQIESLVDFFVGKTLDEIRAIPLYDGRVVADDEPDLASSVTIRIPTYIAAIEDALSITDAPTAETPDQVRTGMAFLTSVGSSRQPGGAQPPRIQVDTSIAGVVIDENGVIINAFIDAAQTRINISEEGELMDLDQVNLLTKRALGDDYNMRRVSNLEKEWYEQARAFAEYIIGKTAAEVASIPLDDSGFPIADDAPDLASSVSINVSSYVEAMQRAIANATAR